MLKNTTKLTVFICILLTAALLTVGCAHPWRIASNPNPVTEGPSFSDEPTDSDTPNESGIPSDTPIDTDVPTDSGSPVDTTQPTEAPTTGGTLQPTTPDPTDGTTGAPTQAPTPTAVVTASPTPVVTAPPTEEPDIAPFSAPSINGMGTFDNSMFGRAKITMVNVWATTCAPCIAELPHIQQLAANFASRGLQVVTVLGDSQTSGAIQTALGIINSMGFNLPVIQNNASVNNVFGVGAYPTTFFIDSNGNIVRIVNTSNSYDAWVSIVSGML